MAERLDKLRQVVNELEEQLRSPESLDEATRALLEEASAEIQAVLEQEDPSQFKSHSLTDRLREKVQEFEADHPTLTGILNRMIDALGQMGI